VYVTLTHATNRACPIEIMSASSGLFAASNPYREAPVPAPSQPPQQRFRALTRPRAHRADADDDSDDERLARRKEKKRAEEEQRRAEAVPGDSRRARKRAAAVIIEPPEAPAQQVLPRRVSPPAPAKPHACLSYSEPARGRARFLRRTTSCQRSRSRKRTGLHVQCSWAICRRQPRKNVCGSCSPGTQPDCLPASPRPAEASRSCGVVDTTRIRSAAVDPEAKLPRRAALLTGALSASRGAVNGYVVFKSAEAVMPALALNMQLLDGRHVRVDRVGTLTGAGVCADSRARVSAVTQLDPRRSAYLGNLHYDADEEEVIALFSPVGAIEAVRIPRDRQSGATKGFGYVCFADPGAAAALRAALTLAGSELHGRPLRVARASSQRAFVADSARKAKADAHAALAGAPTRRDAMAVPGKLARWKERELRAASQGGGGMLLPCPARRTGPAPWEGVHTSVIGPSSTAPGAAAGTASAPVKPGKVRLKPRWRDQGREMGGIPLVAPSSLRPDKLARLTSSQHARKVVSKPSRISSRKRPIVAARKAAAARKKLHG